MKAKIFSNDNLIGTSKLQIGDVSMGCVYGEFLLNEFYFKNIQHYIWEFWESKPDYKKWHSLNLRVQLSNGCFLYTEVGITIADLKDVQNEPLRIDIAGIDRYIIDDFFLETQPNIFVAEPWEPISITQKISFEEELRKEIGPESGKKLFFNNKNTNDNKHILSDFELEAVCHHQGSDDVLFRIQKNGLEPEFAIVHLTWRGSKESPNYPTVQFYSSFDDFKYFKMYPDKAEWEY